MLNLSYCDQGRTEVDFKYLVNLALDQKVSWIHLKGFLHGLTTTCETAKQLNDILLDELQSLHLKLAKGTVVQEELGHQESLEEEVLVQQDEQIAENENQVHHELQASDAENAAWKDAFKNLNFVREKEETEMICINSKRRYACTTCGQLFSKVGDLDQHERIHNSSDNEIISIEGNSSNDLEAAHEESFEIETKQDEDKTATLEKDRANDENVEVIRPVIDDNMGEKYFACKKCNIVLRDRRAGGYGFCKPAGVISSQGSEAPEG